MSNKYVAMLIQGIVCVVVLYALYRFMSRFSSKDEPAKEPPMSDYERGRKNLRDAFFDASGNLRAGAVGMPVPAPAPVAIVEYPETIAEKPLRKSQWHTCDPLAVEPECEEPYLCISGNVDNMDTRCMTGATAKFHCEYQKPRNRWDAKARRCVPA